MNPLKLFKEKPEFRDTDTSIPHNINFVKKILKLYFIKIVFYEVARICDEISSQKFQFLLIVVRTSDVMFKVAKRAQGQKFDHEKFELFSIEVRILF